MRPAARRPGAACVAVAWAALGAVVLTGCVGPVVSEADWDRRTMQLLQKRKEASQAGVDRDFIANVPADRYVNARTPLLLGGDGKVTTRNSPNGRTAVVGWEMRPGRNTGGVSSATAIAADGYYLTAAHAVGDTRMRLVRPGARGPVVTRVRVVWKGDPARGGPDLALIHAPAAGQHYFPLIDDPSPPMRTRVWTGGFGDVRQNQTRGWLRSAGPWQQATDGSTWRIVEHTAPLMRGDSGGPLVDRHGRLLGINTEFLVQPASLLGIDHLRVYRPTAVAPEPEWLEALVQRDRSRRGR